MKKNVLLMELSPEEQEKDAFRRYNRAELLEVILLQAREIEELKERTNKLEAELRERNLAISEAGNIAEASLKLSHIFENAEIAVAQYKENIERISRDRISISKKMVEEAEKEAFNILQVAREEAELMLAQAKEKSEHSKAEADRYWNELSSRLMALYNEHKGLRELVGRLESKQIDDEA